ncbi:hypothetical protein OEA41_000976 [Lepraria neglecta]|uniref:DUF7514 domain-containing protein n=1 Tax=Lepraria neglecta TaxID=209136 RepID=A0AAE0DPY5_9LECA|nr:hypothetical protein OEA41_000976 [Lepraria neglecta]
MVITPKKMAKFYEDIKLSKEVYLWSTVFDCERLSISRIYDARPDIPGLTPIGFERWVILLIQAHPEEEFERLRKVVLEMPISNPDDCKERLPKDISRRLFPDHEDHKVRNRIEGSMAERVALGTGRRESQEEILFHRAPLSHKANVIGNPRAPSQRRRNLRFADQPVTSKSSPTHVPSPGPWNIKS